MKHINITSPSKKPGLILQIILGHFQKRLTPLIFLYMLSSLVNDCPNMLICQRIEYRFSIPAAFYQFILFQDTKLVGNS